MEKNCPFIFYLTLEEKLPEHFYVFDLLLKEHDCILVPVRVDQLQQLVSRTEQGHVMVISSVSSFREYRLFNERVRGILKYVLKSRRISFLELSSFGRLNDSRAHGPSKNYFFLKNPVDGRALVEKMLAYQLAKSEQTNAWPGGPRYTTPGSA